MKLATLSVTVFLMLVSVTSSMAQGLEDFTRFSKAIGKEVSIVDRSGVVREGVVEAVTDQNVMLRLGSGSQTVVRSEIVRADRMRDSNVDGVIKGLLLRLLMAQGAGQGSVSAERDYSPLVLVGFFAALGYQQDAANHSPRPLYRAPSSASPAPSPAPILKLAVRF